MTVHGSSILGQNELFQDESDPMEDIPRSCSIPGQIWFQEKYSQELFDPGMNCSRTNLDPRIYNTSVIRFNIIGKNPNQRRAAEHHWQAFPLKSQANYYSDCGAGALKWGPECPEGASTSGLANIKDHSKLDE